MDAFFSQGGKSVGNTFSSVFLGQFEEINLVVNLVVWSVYKRILLTPIVLIHTPYHLHIVTADCPHGRAVIYL